MTDEELPKQIKKLSARIAELEQMISQIMAPIQDMQRATQQYLRLVDLALRHGGLSPDMLIPEVTDPISKDIIRVLVDKNGQNISQVTERVRARRGSASRRVVRERLKSMEKQDIVEQRGEGTHPTYYISDSVLRKWSQLLGIPI